MTTENLSIPLQALLLENLEIVVDGTGQKKSIQLPWTVWETLLDYVQKTENNALIKAEETWAIDLDGVWKDDRPAEEIANEIMSARTFGREMPTL